jgi:hypothetical protein
MLLTEDAAREKWCPFARDDSGGDNPCTVNRPNYPAYQVRCIASDCMAWRWYDENTHNRYGLCGLAGGIHANDIP